MNTQWVVGSRQGAAAELRRKLKWSTPTVWIAAFAVGLFAVMIVMMIMLRPVGTGDDATSKGWMRLTIAVVIAAIVASAATAVWRRRTANHDPADRLAVPASVFGVRLVYVVPDGITLTGAYFYDVTSIVFRAGESTAFTTPARVDGRIVHADFEIRGDRIRLAAVREVTDGELRLMRNQQNINDVMIGPNVRIDGEAQALLVDLPSI